MQFSKYNRSILFLLLLASALPVYSQQADLAGEITLEDQTGIEEVMVSLYNASGVLVGQVTTDDNGQYQFSDLPTGEVYTLVLEREDNPENGVSVLDQLMLSQHLLAINNLASPFQLLASDVNNSGGNTTLDLILMAKAILGLNVDGFISNWRFFPDTIVFPDPNLPWTGTTNAEPEILLETDVTDFNFIGIKPGDLDGSAN